MKYNFSVKQILEVTVVTLIIGGINLFFPEHPGFLSYYFNPYFTFALISAGFYGKYGGLYALFLGAIYVLFPFPLLRSLFYQRAPEENYLLTMLTTQSLPFSTTLMTAFLIGSVKDNQRNTLNELKQNLKTVALGRAEQETEIQALKTVNFELEQRVLTQKDSIIALYSRLQKIYSANFKKALEIIIDTVITFTAAESCSIWEYRAEEKSLKLHSQKGWPQEASLTVVEAENSIEGWVARNNIIFSAKMLMQYENLKKIDQGRNIYTVPILEGHKVWGVFNIESIPFEKYNLYTEKLLLIIMAMVAPALERAIAYEALKITETMDPVTNMPLFSQFYAVLEKEISRVHQEKGTFSIIILELINYGDLIKEFSKKELFLTLLNISEKIKKMSNNKALFFHYKDDNQICCIYPDTDYDGCSLFCLNILELINTTDWIIHDKIVYPEMILGYASLGDADKEAGGMINSAENLLEMQKI